MNFPDDTRLIAIGKYSMLGRERHSQLRRLQTISKTVMHHANPLLKAGEQQPPTDASSLKTLQDCVENAQDAWNKLVALNAEMEKLKPEAWGETKDVE